MPQINFANKPNFLRPELLKHGQIPMPLSGMAPRIVLSEKWWLATRRSAYAANNYCCWACGATDALEAHEAYDIDYVKYRMTYVETVALCTSCHNFIHIGLTRRRVAKAEFKRIVLHGHKILKNAKLKANWGLSRHLMDLELWMFKVIRNTEPEPSLPPIRWDSWRLVVFDVEYPPRFKSEVEADNFYRTRSLNE
jgi:hypothetical protein